MAEALFNDLAGARGSGFRAESAGVSARKGLEMAPYAREVLDEIGVRPGKHRSRRIERPMLEDADLVLVMGARHAARIEALIGPSDKVHLLGRFAGEESGDEVPDPYGLTLFAYRASARQINDYVERALGRMERELPA